MKRAFTLIELIIAVGILGIIMAAIMTLFMVAVKNYQVETTRNTMQKEINYLADDLGGQIKQAGQAPEAYSTFNRSPSRLILALPAIDESENFIYEGQNQLFDYFIYELIDGKITKRVITDPDSGRLDKDSVIIENVTEFNCSYSPPTNSELVSCSIKTARSINDRMLNFEALKTARLRNHQ